MSDLSQVPDWELNLIADYCTAELKKNLYQDEVEFYELQLKHVLTELNRRKM